MRHIGKVAALALLWSSSLPAAGQVIVLKLSSRVRLVILAGILAGGTVLGCAITPAEREATTRAWAERDAERARECERNRGRWVAGACLYGGGA